MKSSRNIGLSERMQSKCVNLVNLDTFALIVALLLMKQIINFLNLHGVNMIHSLRPGHLNRKNMKLIGIFFISLCLSVHCHAQAPVKKLSRHQKDSLKKELETILINDQKYRWMLMYGEIDERKIAEYQQMGEAAKFKRMMQVQKNQIGISQLQKDSLWSLQNPIDSVNFVTVLAIIKQFGFPHRYIEPYKVSTIIMHASPALKNDDFFKCLMAEVSKGNLPGIEYARIYDNYLYGQRRDPLYYVDGVDDDGNPIIPKNKVETNKARVAIGLKPLK